MTVKTLKVMMIPPIRMYPATLTSVHPSRLVGWWIGRFIGRSANTWSGCEMRFPLRFYGGRRGVLTRNK